MTVPGVAVLKGGDRHELVPLKAESVLGRRCCRRSGVPDPICDAGDSAWSPIPGTRHTRHAAAEPRCSSAFCRLRRFTARRLTQTAAGPVLATSCRVWRVAQRLPH